MAVILTEGFDHQSPTVNGWTGAVSGYTTGRFGGFATINNFSAYFEKNLPSSYTTVIVGMAFKQAGTILSNFFRLMNDTTTAVLLSTTNSGLLRFTNSAGTQLGTDVNILTNAWYQLEFKVVIHASTGSIQLRINGNPTPVLNVTGLNTGSLAINKIRLGPDGNSPGINLDDFYMLDTSGSVNNDFLGDMRIETLLPSGNGNSSQLDGSDGNTTDNYALVDEATPNSDTDYVESSDVGDKDTYAFGNLSSTAGTIACVKIMPFAKKTDAGTRTIASIARLSGTEADGTDRFLGGSYQYHEDFRETKPGGGAWTISDVNSAEFGVKVTA